MVPVWMFHMFMVSRNFPPISCCMLSAVELSGKKLARPLFFMVMTSVAFLIFHMVVWALLFLSRLVHKSNSLLGENFKERTMHGISIVVARECADGGWGYCMVRSHSIIVVS